MFKFNSCIQFRIPLSPRSSPSLDFRILSCFTDCTSRKMYFSTALIFLLTVLDILVYYLQKEKEEDNAKQKNSSTSLDQLSLQKEDHGEKKDTFSSSYDLQKQKEEDAAEQKKSSPSSSLDQVSVPTEDHGDWTVSSSSSYYLQKHQEEDPAQQKKSSPSSSPDQQSVQKEDHGDRKDSSSSSSLDKQCRRFSLAEIKLATHDFDDAFLIGTGGFGKVYRGTIDFGGDIDVAIKRLNLDSNQGAAEFWAEIEMLSKFRHSHIVSLLGYHEESGKREMILVYEYLPNGSLEDHLHKRRANGGNFSPLTWVRRLRICIDAARGLDYLHTGTGVQSRVIHRDVKSSNILLDENWAGKIADFGLSRSGPAYQSCTTNVYTDQIRGTFGYMDAQYFATHRLTRKSDVYAFGVVLFEVLCGRPAVDFTLDEKQHSLAAWAKRCVEEGTIDQFVDPCLRGEVSTRCLKEFSQIAYKCLLWSPKDRPTMTEVVARLEFVLVLTLRKYIRVTIAEKVRLLFTIKLPVPSNPKKNTIKKEEQPTMVAEGDYAIKKEEQPTTVVEGDSHHGDNSTSLEPIPLEAHIVTPNLKMYTYAELKSATKNFRPHEKLGAGGFGHVFKGWVDGETYAPSKAGVGIPVTVKKSDSDSYRDLEEWQAEVKFLGKFSHPNLVKLLGYCQKKEEFLLVYEYMQEGELDYHLFKRGGGPHLSWDTRIIIAMGAAQGLAFMHATERRVIYGDFNSSNILLDGEFNAKLSDFGSTSFGQIDGESRVTIVEETYGYTAPEYISTGHLYMKSDVYSFGVVLLEIITGLRVLDNRWRPLQHNLVDTATPFLTDRKKLHGIMDARMGREYPSKGAIKAATLVLNCLNLHPKHRPSMEEVVTSLEEIKAIKKRPPKVLKSKTNNGLPHHKESYPGYRHPHDMATMIISKEKVSITD